jgi:hypothetical protein
LNNADDWISANPPNSMHADADAGDKPVELMVVGASESL